MTYKIGVDSGGTHITATAYQDDKEIFSVEGGPGNIFLKPDETVENLILTIKKLVSELPNKNCSIILCGIAGLESIKNPDNYLERLKRSFATITPDIYFISDAKLALINGLEGKDGFLVIAGTGSIVYAKQNKKYLRAGGWGYLLDDVGSAYKISQEAIQHVLNLYDRGKKSSLIIPTLKFFDAKSISNIIAKYYQMNRTQIAAFAEQVGKIAQDGNDEAIKIIKHQGRLLSDEIIALINRCQDWNLTYKLVMAGSVLTKNKIIQDVIKTAVKNDFPRMNIEILKRSNTAAVNYF